MVPLFDFVLKSGDGRVQIFYALKTLLNKAM